MKLQLLLLGAFVALATPLPNPSGIERRGVCNFESDNGKDCTTIEVLRYA